MAAGAAPRGGDDRRWLARACQRWATRLDVSTAAVARGLGLAARTLRAWTTRSARPLRRGRPAHRLTAAEVRQMRAALILHGPSVSVATVEAWCPSASRRAIAAWLRADRRGRRARLHVVQWQRPGRVWAMDLSEAPQLSDGVYPYLLHVRDVASGCHLAALPIVQPTAAIVCALLQALVRRWGPPLVLKVDNGSAFISFAVQAWAGATGIRLLYSPPRYPRYNGAIEASIGAITTRAHHVAAAAGHPETWSCQDVEHARTWANAIVRRPGPHSAHARWTRRSRITRMERRRFLQACTQALRRRSRHHTARVQQRLAIVDTLRRLNYVSITRRADLLHGLRTKTRQGLRA